MRVFVVLALCLLMGCASSRTGGRPASAEPPLKRDEFFREAYERDWYTALAGAEIDLSHFRLSAAMTVVTEFEAHVETIKEPTPAQNVSFGWLTEHAREIRFIASIFDIAEPADLSALYAADPERMFNRFIADGTTLDSPACYRLFAISNRGSAVERGFQRMLKLLQADAVKTFRLRMVKASTLMGLGIEEGRAEFVLALELLATFPQAKVEDFIEFGGARTLKALDLARNNDFAAASALIDEIIASNPPASMKPRLDRYGPGLKEIAQAWPAEQALWAAEKDLPRVEFETDQGRLVITLFEDDAPNTVASFLMLVESGFYDGLVFHRVVPHFVVQGGDPDGTGSGGPGYSIKRELGRKHFRGSIGMARSEDPDSAGSQFYFCLSAATTHHLDAGYCVFGRVSEGLDVMDKLRLGSRVRTARVLNKRTHEYKVEKLPEKE
jgi:cyclophilin family peptidyl-prolyl cis-trans isomerase